MNELLLIGAGASVEAGLPDSYGMTLRIADLFKSQPSSKLKKVLFFVIGGLLFQHGIRGKNALQAGVDVEELFTAVDLLSRRLSLEASPFIASWHTSIDELDWKEEGEGVFHSRSRLADAISKMIETALDSRYPPQYHSARIEHEIKHLFDKYQGRPGKGYIFKMVADQMVEYLAQVVWIENSERVRYLRPLVNLAESQRNLTVASLNYDNALEKLFESSHTPFSTGIDEWSTTGIFNPPKEGVFLLKLHGSIDWALRPGPGSKERPMPYSIIERVESDVIKQQPFRPAVLFGHRNKLTVKGPFLDLLRAFELELKKAERITIIGYSFRDTHVNEYLSEWINDNPLHSMRVVNPNLSDEEPYVFTLVNRFNNIEIIRKKTGTALPELFPD